MLGYLWTRRKLLISKLGAGVIKERVRALISTVVNWNHFQKETTYMYPKWLCQKDMTWRTWLIILVLEKGIISISCDAPQVSFNSYKALVLAHSTLLIRVWQVKWYLGDDRWERVQTSHLPPPVHCIPGFQLPSSPFTWLSTLSPLSI